MARFPRHSEMATPRPRKSAHEAMRDRLRSDGEARRALLHADFLRRQFEPYPEPGSNGSLTGDEGTP